MCFVASEYDDIVVDTIGEPRERVLFAGRAGLDREVVIIGPDLGFFEFRTLCSPHAGIERITSHPITARRLSDAKSACR